MIFLRRRLLLFIVLIFLFVLLVYREHSRSLLATPPTSLFDKGVIFIYSPINRAMSYVGHFFTDGWNHYMASVGASKENENLRRELSAKDLQLFSLQEQLRSRGVEDKIKKGAYGLGLEGVSASIIAFDPYSVSKTAWISVGSGDGVKSDQPVMSEEGLVGRTLKVGEKSSQILLLNDSRFAVDVVDVPTRVRALVVGMDNRNVLKRYPMLTRLEYLNLGDEIHEGDLLITSGLSPIYPKGIPVGNIANVKTERDSLFQSAAVIPCVDLSKVDLVFVVTGGSGHE